MKFLVDKSLKLLVILIVSGLLLVILVEVLWLKNHFTRIEAVHQQIDYARTLQLTSQQISSALQKDENGLRDMPTLLALIEKQNHQFQLLKNGGRVPETEIFLQPIQRLPEITFTNLQALWEKYKTTLLKLQENPTYEAAAKAQSINVTEWHGRLTSDLYAEAEKVKGSFNTLLVALLVTDAAILSLLVFGFLKFVVYPLNQMEKNTQLHHHSNGYVVKELKSLSVQINEVIEQLRDASDFVKGIGEGKLDMDYKTELDAHYEPGKNKLADELIAMQSKLKTLNTEEQRRQWANEGLTKFVDILRNANDNLTVLGDRIISTLVQYTKSNQGGLYILNDDDENNKYLELISLFAFNIKKFEKQKLKLGEGILGQTFLEKETTYLTHIPEDYVRITSGLGDAIPKSILMVPLKVDKEVYGIVELASFGEFAPHEISFVEKLGETIAATLSSVKINQKNRKLLEQFQEQTEQMRAQEEEMRQNMEELTSTQEGMHRLVKEAQDKEVYLNNLMDATPDAIVAIDRDYKVVLRNKAPLFDQFLTEGIRYEKGYYVLGLFKKEEFEYHKGIYDKAFAGETVRVTKDYFGKKYSITYNPLRAASGEIIGVSIFAHDESDLEALKVQLADKERLYNENLQALQASMSHKTEEGTWKLAEEVEKTFRLQLEALRIAQNKPNRTV